MAPPKVDLQRGVWTVAVLVFVALAVGAPVQMARAQQAKNQNSKGASASATSAKVSMVSISFRPASLAVRKGTEVVFENDDVAPHTVTGATGGPVDSGILAPRKIFKLVINEALDYVCQIHPSMKGKIILTG